MFVQEWDYNAYDYFINYKPQYRPISVAWDFEKTSAFILSLTNVASLSKDIGIVEHMWPGSTQTRLPK